jgi:hypothetical protein
MWMQEIWNRKVPGVTLKITSFIFFNLKYSKLWLTPNFSLTLGTLGTPNFRHF